MRTTTVELSIGRITFSEELGVHVLDQQVIFAKLARFVRFDDLSDQRIVRFAEAISQAITVEGEIKTWWATAGDMAEAVHHAYMEFLAMPGRDMTLILNALNEVSTPPNKPELLPTDQVGKKKEINLTSPASGESSASSSTS